MLPNVFRRICAAIVLVPALCLLLSSCSTRETQRGYQAFVDSVASTYGPYVAIKLPITNGVKISNPIQLALGPGNILYAANQTGEVYTLRDSDNDGLEDEARLFCNVKEFGLRSPAGFAHRGDTVYIGTSEQIRAFLDLNKDGRADTSWVFFDDIPHSLHPYEWTSALTFGKDNWLYLALTTDSFNASPSPDPNGYRGSIIRISPDGKNAEIVVNGIRSVYGMAFNDNGDLFFTDNEGGGNPNEELNLVRRGAFYGHNPKKYKHDSVTSAAFTLHTEMAPSGIEFNQSSNDFGGTAGDLFIAFYGPGERWSRGGVARVAIKHNSNGQYVYEEQPIADIAKLSDLAFGPDGSLYLAQHGKADYWYNAVYENEGNFYKLIYDPSLKNQPKRERPEFITTASDASANSIQLGKSLFAESACLGCHAVDGQTELLGPNLKDVGKRLSRQEIMEEIERPSERIKPSMMAVNVIKNDGQRLLGRVVNASDQEISIMLVGNHIVNVTRKDISKVEDVPTSLMYEGLTKAMTEQEKTSLLDYIVSLCE